MTVADRLLDRLDGVKRRPPIDLVCRCRPLPPPLTVRPAGWRPEYICSDCLQGAALAETAELFEAPIRGGSRECNS